MAIAPLRVAVLASGRGTLLQALIAAHEQGVLPIQLVLVASDRPLAPALRIAEAHGIPTLGLNPGGYDDRHAYDSDLFDRIAATGAELVVLAGFMRWLHGDVVTAWQGRMINIHPSLLPRYPGLHTHQRALDAGDAEHGASVHYVTAELDGGPLIAQVHVPIRGTDDADSLARRLLPREHGLLVECLRLIAAGRIACPAGKVLLDGAPLAQPLRLDGPANP